jgi:hypothetical protein
MYRGRGRSFDFIVKHFAMGLTFLFDQSTAYVGLCDVSTTHRWAARVILLAYSLLHDAPVNLYTASLASFGCFCMDIVYFICEDPSFQKRVRTGHENN